MDQPIRFPWEDFPDVLIHASESLVKKHHAYPPAKAGDAISAVELVTGLMSSSILLEMRVQFDFRHPTLLSVHADESGGVNAIPEVMAATIAGFLNWPHERRVIQANLVSHTGASGYARLQRQAIFGGPVVAGLNYILVDDFIGQGGTLANLRAYIMAHGGAVLGATVLTGKEYSAKLTPTDLQVAGLRRKHGHIEDWWRQRFGFDFDCLTASEVRYLSRTATSARIIEGLEEISG